MRGRSERIIGFDLDHRQDCNAHRRERLFERMEMREQRGLDSNERRHSRVGNEIGVWR